MKENDFLSYWKNDKNEENAIQILAFLVSQKNDKNESASGDFPVGTKRLSMFSFVFICECARKKIAQEEKLTNCLASNRLGQVLVLSAL